MSKLPERTKREVRPNEPLLFWVPQRRGFDVPEVPSGPSNSGLPVFSDPDKDALHQRTIVIRGGMKDAEFRVASIATAVL